jgi:hypothetical protein
LRGNLKLKFFRYAREFVQLDKGQVLWFNLGSGRVPQKGEKMKLIEKSSSVDTSGTFLLGYVSTTYATIVEKLGEPHYTGYTEDKVQAEWLLKFEDETTGEVFVASIYDWKNYENGINYGKYDWHIGGKDIKALTAVQNLFNV